MPKKAYLTPAWMHSAGPSPRRRGLKCRNSLRPSLKYHPEQTSSKKVRGWPARGEGRVLSKEELKEDDGEAKEDEEEDVGEEEGQAAVALLPARVPAVLRKK